MGEVAAGGGDGAAGVEIATLACRKAERFAEKHGGKMRASTSWSRARKAGEGQARPLHHPNARKGGARWGPRFRSE